MRRFSESDDDDGSSYDAEPFVEGLAEIERRRDKEMAVTLGEDVQADLVERGPLGVYLTQCQIRAIDSLCQLVTIDPGDGPNIGRLQASVQEYIKVRGWIRGVMNDATVSAQEIDEEWGRAREQGRDEHS